MIFVLDENWPPLVARVLHAFCDGEHQVDFIRDRYGGATDDETWLADFGRMAEKPAVLSGDINIVRNPARRQALREAGLPYFLLKPAWQTLSPHERAWRVLKAWPEIVRSASSPIASVYSLSVNGRVTRIERT